LRKWREALIAKGVKPQTVERVCNSARAALNLAAHDPRVAENREAWREALLSVETHYEPVDRVISDAEVFALMEAAYEINPAFGLFIEVLARTGTRRSQAIALKVKDLQKDRLMMPSSLKGRNRKVSKFPVPIAHTLAQQLANAAAGRPADAPLLTYTGTFFDAKAGYFKRAAAQVGIDETAYCLRHSSISRAILAGVPLALVAKNHDTSTDIIEKVYGAFINHTEAADALTRKGQLGAAPLRLVI